MSRPARRRRFLDHDRRVLLLALAAGLPGMALAALLLWSGDHGTTLKWTLSALVVAIWLAVGFATRDLVVHPLQTLANLLAALREEDFSFRARAEQHRGALGEAMSEVNALAETLQQQRLGALEASALLRKVMEEIEVAVFAFDRDGRLSLANRAAGRLLGAPIERLLGRGAAELGLAEALAGPPSHVTEAAFAGGGGRFEVRHGSFRQRGVPHRLLVLADMSRALRDEERQAWQRLIRVLGHELNNSLAPIRSLARSLESLLAREPRPLDAEADIRRGLAVIATRAESLSRFMEAYARLARLPTPRLEHVALGGLVRRAAKLETRVSVAIAAGPDLTLRADGDQLEQLLINLMRNAADAALETGGGVEVGWAPASGIVELWVDDEGPGLPNTANLFVPFFTTKPGGSGIGLVLSRQIAEAHGGTLTLANRAHGHGCRAYLRLPV